MLRPWAEGTLSQPSATCSGGNQPALRGVTQAVFRPPSGASSSVAQPILRGALRWQSGRAQGNPQALLRPPSGGRLRWQSGCAQRHPQAVLSPISVPPSAHTHGFPRFCRPTPVQPLWETLSTCGDPATSLKPALPINH